MIHSLTVSHGRENLHRVHRRSITTFLFVPGINILAGPNGSGKSSIIEFIRSRRDGIKKKRDGRQRFQFVDCEKHNPRTASVEDVYHGDRMDEYDLVVMGLVIERMLPSGSHGEIGIKIFDQLLPEPDILWLVDEPEQALDVFGLELFVKKLSAFQHIGGQAVVATHHPRIIFEPSFHIVELTNGYVKKLKKHCALVNNLAQTKV